MTRAAAIPLLPRPGPVLPPVLWALLFGNFVVGTGIMIVPAMMNELSTSLKVSIPNVGRLISWASLLMCLGAPLLAWLVAGWDRRRLLALTMGWYGAMHFLCALMPGFESLLWARVLAMVAPAIFTPQAAACIGLLVPDSQRGKAISLVLLGWSIASVVGMPLGAWLGGAYGWRSAFMMVALMGLASALWVWFAMPNGVKPPAFSLLAWRQTFRSKALMLCVAVTALASAGQFVLFSYLAPYFKATIDITAGELGLFFMGFGVFGFAGNLWLSRNIDRIGSSRGTMLAVGSMALSLAVWPLGASFGLAALVCVPWALGCFTCNSAQQTRLVSIAPALAAGSVALNSSAMYAGQAFGAASGGWLIDQGQISMLHWAGLVGLSLAMAISWLATRAHRDEKRLGRAD
jgi:predicted MFS family arabinose efflux permease